MIVREEMMKDIKSQVNEPDGIPRFTKIEWDLLLKKYNCANKPPILDPVTGKLQPAPNPEKDLWLLTIAEYICENNIPFPRKDTIRNKSTVDFRFLRFCKESPDKWIKNIDSYSNILERYAYKRPFSDCGIGIIDGPVAYNMIADYYTYEDRMRCPYKTSLSPIDTWRNPQKLSVILKYLYRKPAWSDGGGEINLHSWMGVFRLALYQAGTFKPTVAKAIYTITKAKKILDTSCGWGDRLAAFYGTSNAVEYVGTDPNMDVWEKYQIMCINYEKLLGGTPVLKVYDDHFTCHGIKKVKIYNVGAENLPWETFDRDFDCVFTSPPYFATEMYAKGRRGEENQSWKRYGEYKSWRDNFFIPVSEWSYKVLGEGKHFLCNIMDPEVKNIRYPASDDLIDFMDDKYPHSFIGQIGMKHMRRAAVHINNSDHFDNCTIENVWVFRKGAKKFDLMSTNRNTALDGFLNTVEAKTGFIYRSKNNKPISTKIDRITLY